jgi:prepilin-type N-terminal cleavage/methylation domain-containing protein
MRLTLSNRSRTERNGSASAVASTRAGMTLIEVIVAMVLLTGALLSMSAFIARYANVTGAVARRSEANELVADRLEEVKGALKYSAIDSLYAKTEPTITGHPGLTRQTLVTRTGGFAPSLYDYKTVTVIVNGPGLKTPSKKTTIISVF